MHTHTLHFIRRTEDALVTSSMSSVSFTLLICKGGFLAYHQLRQMLLVYGAPRFPVKVTFDPHSVISPAIIKRPGDGGWYVRNPL